MNFRQSQRQRIPVTKEYAVICLWRRNKHLLTFTEPIFEGSEETRRRLFLSIRAQIATIHKVLQHSTMYKITRNTDSNRWQGKIVIIIKAKGMFLYSVVSSQLDRLKCFTLHPLADLFIQAPNQLLWEAF